VTAAILVFARAPNPGEVKTRLIPALGADGAARLHLELVDRVLGEASRVEGARLELWCSARHALLQECAERHGAGLCEQSGSDLGERMANALDRALLDSDRAVLVGSDVPGLDARYLRNALGALDHSPVVLGPAEDGGYVLVGLRRSAPALFDGVAWGTAGVLAQTRERLAGLGLRWHELEPLWDVDRPEDLARLSR
jgi:rSAM/selenodomain-associated transferase 1